jgi:hypothetical protein
MPYSTTNINEITKETYDARIQASFDDNTGTLKLIKRETPTEGITALGRVFTINLQNNESYGSQATEGGAFPAAGALVDDRATVNYRSQFASFDFTGDVEDLATSMTLQHATNRIVKNTTEAFDAKQDFFVFGPGTGVLGQIDSVAANDITMLNSVTYGYGARNIMKGQRVNAYDVSGATYRVGDMVVQSVNRSTDVVSVDAAAAAIAADDDDVLVFEDSYNFAPQGFAYHVADSGTWLTLSRSTNPSTQSLVHDAASASIDWDMVETALVKSRNLRGDAAPKFDYTLIGHPVQHKNLRALARSSGNVQFNAQVGGNGTIDLAMKDVALAGMSFHESSNCSPSDMWGLKLGDWAIEEVAPRQLYKHNDGNVFIQKLASSTAYADAKEGRIYWRYNLVCKAPYNQFRIKNINFATAETRIKRS